MSVKKKKGSRLDRLKSRTNQLGRHVETEQDQRRRGKKVFFKKRDIARGTTINRSQVNGRVRFWKCRKIWLVIRINSVLCVYITAACTGFKVRKRRVSSFCERSVSILYRPLNAYLKIWGKIRGQEKENPICYNYRNVWLELLDSGWSLAVWTGKMSSQWILYGRLCQTLAAKW